MNADAGRQFVDTTVLVYAFDTSAGPRKVAAERLLAGLWHAGTGCLSIQVLQEFFVTVTRKVTHPLSIKDATDRVREFAAWRIFTPTADDVLAAIALHERTRLAFWDAMIVHAAAESGCQVLWTEDLNPGQELRGVRISNPF